jgi:hypothetical protein
VLQSWYVQTLLTGVASAAVAAPAFLQWRYAVGEDREALVKATRQDTEEDKAAKEKVHQIKVRLIAAAAAEGTGSQDRVAVHCWVAAAAEQSISAGMLS